MNILTFLVFYLFLYFLGDIVRRSLNLNTLIYGINLSILNPLFFLFVSANFVFLFNFLFIGSIGVYLVWIFSFLLLILNVKKVTRKFEFLFPAVVIASLLSFSTYGIDFHYDAGSYHLLNQSWILQEKIVFGLSNIMFPLGNQSLYEYLSTIFLVFDNLVILHFLNLVFITVFFHFLYEITRSGKSNFLKLTGILLTLFGILDNFGYQGGANGFPNIQNLGKPDIPVAVLLIISNILIFNYLITNDKSDKNMKLIVYLCIFLIQLRPIALYILLILVYALSTNGFSFLSKKENRIFIFSSGALTLMWLLKNLIVTGCLLFPVQFTCFFNFSWANQNLVIEANNHYSNAYLPYTFDQNIINWFSEWRGINVNNQILINFIGSYLILYALMKIFTIKDLNITKQTLFIRVYLVTTLGFFFLTIPLFRYSYGLLTSFLLFLVLNRKFRFEFISQTKFKVFLLSVIILSPALIVRGYSYLNVIEDPINLKVLKIPKIEYTNSDSWGVVPVPANNNPHEFCWVNINCNPENKLLKLETKFNYVFISENVNNTRSNG